MHSGLKILFIFIDGLGLGSNDPDVNPLMDSARLPNLARLLDQSIPLDATLGVSGLPQSATGQAALLTGLNAAELMGRHIEGFPPPRLKELVQKHNVFSKLLGVGKSCTFANAYWIDDVAHIPPRRESVTTVATVSAFGGVRGKKELLSDRAVYQDLTREVLRERGYNGPLLTPEESAEHLMEIANDHDFTLFEYFQTDHAGHSNDPDRVDRCLKNLDRFFSKLWDFKGVLVVTSDHGNIEDMSTRSHTMNPVPFYASDSGLFHGMENITQLTPKLLYLLGG